MKSLWLKLFAALLIALCLLSPAAVMEEAVESVEPVDVALEEQTVDIVADDTLGEDEVYAYSSEAYGAAPSDALFAASGEVAISAANFPDSGFRSHLTKFYDYDDSGSLSASELADVKLISDGSISDFTGIKLLTSVEEINVADGNVSLDVSGMKSLKRIGGVSGTLTSLNVKDCANLEELNLGSVQLNSLDVSGCPKLAKIYCYYIASFDVSGHTALTELSGYYGTLNASGCTGLTELYFYPALMSSLDVSNCTGLKSLNCYNNKLTSDTLNFSGCTSLETLYCGGNPLVSLDVTGLTSLTDLACGSSQLTSLNVNGCANLTSLSCDVNQLTSLDVSDCANLTRLICYLNKELSSLNVRGLKQLEELNCNTNKLASVDITGCTKLVQCYTKGTYSEVEGHDWYQYSNGSEGATLVVNRGQKVVTGLSTKSSSKTKTKVSNKKLKVTAYVGTPVQMDTNGETGKSFKSSDKKIATVNSKGVVTPRKAGKAKITYKTASANYTVTLTVKDLTVPKWVVLNMKGTVAAKVGDKVTLTPTMNAGAVSKFKWATSDKKIATVKNGVVTFKKKGTVTITVTTVKGNKKAKVKFKISK